MLLLNIESSLCINQMNIKMTLNTMETKKIAPTLRIVNLNRKAYTIPLLFRIFAPNILES